MERTSSFIGKHNLDVGIIPNCMKFFTNQLKTLSIGESILVEDRSILKIGGYRWRASRSTGFKFKARTTSRGVRVWRTA